MDVYETESEFKSIPILPQLISLGINHSLCISRTNASANSSRSRKKSDEGRYTTSYLNVLSWGKVPFNCLGQGVEVNTSEFPRVIPFFSGRRVTQVSCGDYHSAVLVCSSRENINAGTVFTFGLGNSGRLGYHIDTNSEIISQQIGTDDKDEPSWCTPVPQPVGMSIGLRNNVVTISCGANHTLVTTADGYLYAWGVGAHGVLGNGSVANRYIPVKVIFPQDTFISKCAAGARHSMALDIKGNIWSWGYGGNGRLGLGSTRSCFTPNLIEIFDTYEVFQISCGDSHSACLDRFGTVYTWGSCRGGKLGLGNILSDVLEPTIVQSLKGIHIIQVSCGSGNTLALSSSGKIYQWGSTLGFNKQTDGLISHTVYSPEPVAETGFKNIFVTSGPYSFAAINIFGDLLTWGLGTGYRLGHGDSKDHVIPKFVSYLRTRVYIDNLLKTYDEAAFKVEDTVEKTVNPYDERRIQQIAVGDAHGALLTCNGTVYTWGANNGTGCNSTTEPLENYCEPILFNHFSSKITKIACGSSHTLAVTVNGLLFSWGSNESGQLGHGDLRSRVVPDSVSNIENCINVFAGIDNSGCICSVSHENMMKDEYGTLWVFGSSTCGKLGLGENMTSAVMTPREVNNITGVHSVALGPMHSLALTSDGTLYAAGAGSGGRLGTGNTANSFTFVQVKTDHKFVAVGAGASHSLGISMENDLYGWGEGKYLTFDEDVLEPTIINTIPSTTGQAKVVALAVAANHSLVLSQSGNLSGFGDNSYGQLGVLLSMKSSANNFIKMPLPVNVQGNICCIATSRYFSSCSNLRGDAFSWGLAKDHRLGIGETKSKIVYKPTPIANTSMIGDLMDKFELDSYKHTSMSGYETILNYFLDELHYSSDPHSINWRNLQIVLKNEEKITSEASIKLFEEDLVKCLKTHVDFILRMSESYGRVRALQFKLLSMVKDFCTSLRGQKEISTKPGREFFSPFKAKLTQIEKLVEILFLQPAYFVRLAMFSHDLELVSNIVHHVYGDIQVPRVHNQYFALLRSLLREETSLFFKPTNPLNAFCSPFSRILRTYAMNKYLIIENAHLFLSQTDQQSVVSHLLTYSSPILIPQEGFEYKDQKRYKEGMCRFGSFIVFLATVLSRLVLHNNIKLLFTQMYNLVREKIPVDWASPAVPLEYLAIFPLIPVFVFAIIQPFFTNPNPISQMCGLGVMGDENVLRNMSVISSYFDYIVNPELKMPPMPAVLTSVAQTLYSNLSRLFLEYLRSILHVEDNFYTDLTMQIFKSHFDTDYVNVSIPSDTVAKLVNLCHSSSHYLNFSAHDPLIKVISSISGSKKLSPSDVIYPADFVEKLSGGLTNFKVDHRFMVYDRNMSFCTFSNTFVPQKLAYRQSTFSEDCVKFISVIVRYVPLGKYDPCKILQDSLTQLDDLRVQYGTYDDLTDEMFLKSKYFSSLSSPDFKRADIAKQIFDTVQKLKNDITPTLVGKSILKKCLERIRHRKYLLYIYQHQNEIEQCRRNFEAQISYNVEYLNSCINSLLYGHIDPAIKRAAIKHRVNLFTLNSNIENEKSETKKSYGKKSYGKKSYGKKSDGKSVSFKEYSCLELYRNGTLVPDDSVTTRVFNRLVMAFSASIDTGCYITLRGIDHSEHKELEFLSFELLQKFVDSSNSGYHQIFTNPSYPAGMFVIKASFLVDTFMALVRN